MPREKGNVLTFDEYVGRYRMLQHVLERDEKSLALMEKEAYKDFARRFGKADDPVLRKYATEWEELKFRTEKKRRLCERYAERLARAIFLIPYGEVQEYARYHYLYGFTNEEFSEVSSYSLRTVYRLSIRAKRELTASLLRVQPVRKRLYGKKFKGSGALPRKSYRLGREHRSLAALTAHRKSARYREMLLPG